MNKQELIDAVAAKVDMSKSAIEETVNTLIGTISKEVAAGNTVQLVGFGSFSRGKSRVERQILM